ncbi:MAG: hypothetical protein JO250_20960 [Armatimonadetes bacterium]|nr:hypothetical protein [Armatimonadota bacterium]
MDTTTPGGKRPHVFGALAEFERTPIRERTQAGRARGRVGGRKPVLSGRKAETSPAPYHSRKAPVGEGRRTLGVSHASLYRVVGAQQKEEPGA